jgi:hypothetical protein
MTQRPWLRPSALPKLALCAHYRGDPEAGEAAQRGTRMDEAFRARIAGNPWPEPLDEDEGEAVGWAITMAKRLANGLPLASDPEQLRISVYGMEGTADLLCLDGRWSADLKSGQRRNYVEQQAAYALGFMEKYFLDSWTVYLLYADKFQTERLDFTRESAIEKIKAVLLKANSDEPPMVNDYCGWCAMRFVCPARREQLGIVPIVPGVILEEMPSEKLRDFVLCCEVVHEQEEKARDILCARAKTGEKIDGVSFVTKRGSRRLAALKLLPIAAQIGTSRLLAAFKTVSEKTAREIWGWAGEAAGDFPEREMIETDGSTFVRVGHPKKKGGEISALP